MALKTGLVEALKTIGQERAAFLASLSEEERNAPGAIDHWCAKDIIAHLAHWEARMAQMIVESLRGETPQLVTDIDRANAEIWQTHCGRPWAEIIRFSDEAGRQLLSQTQALDEATLTDPGRFAWLNGQPLWRRIVGNGYTHAMMHFASFYAERGEGQRAMAIWEKAAGLLDPLDDSPAWRGTNRYNIACGYALAGLKEPALQTLREALALRPDLRAWAKDDSDLASLRQEPAYQALVQE